MVTYAQEISASMAEAGEPKTKLAIPAEPSLEATEELAEELAEEPLLAHETLPLELPGDLGTTPLQGEGGRPTQVLSFTVNPFLYALLYRGPLILHSGIHVNLVWTVSVMLRALHL